jgi:hypothetical protein
LPPHAVEAEQAALGCVLQVSAAAAEELLGQLDAHWFYELRHQTLFRVFRDTVAKVGAWDIVIARQALKDAGKLTEVGGVAYLTALVDCVPSAANFPFYRDILEDKAKRRALARFAEKVKAHGLDESQDVFALLDEVKAMLPSALSKGDAPPAPPLKIWTMDELRAYEPPAHLQLVGDNELFMGYDGVVLLAGPGSSGKSLAVDSLALAGAIGRGTWMGRKVHRKFKTLIIQAENGTTRLKRLEAALRQNHPEVAVGEHIFISSPPEGGIPFHRADFREAVRETVKRLGVDLVVVDPWSQVATEDAAKEVVDKLAEIRSCFPTGDDCPCLLIVAHTKKPRPEDVRKGRGLTYLIAGSVALPNSARCAYVLLPWSDDPEDDRIYWCCPKLNNGEMYAASVWKRRFGTFFEPDTETDPKAWGREEEDYDARAIGETDVIEAFEGQTHLTKAALAKRLVKRCQCGEATAYRAFTPGPKGYLAHLLEKSEEGWLKLKEGKAE